VRVHASLAAPVGGISHHSEQLMGITAYGDPNFQEESAQALVQELGIKSIGLMTTITSMAPKGLTVFGARVVVCDAHQWNREHSPAALAALEPELCGSDRVTGCQESGCCTMDLPLPW